MTRYHPIYSDFWFPGGRGPCWVCGVETEMAYLDQAWQHLDCDAWPSGKGDVVVVRGREEIEERTCDTVSGPTVASTPTGGSGGPSTAGSAVRAYDADARGFIMSAGLDMTDAIHVMELATRVASRGLAEYRQVVDALVTALNATVKHPAHGSGEWIGLNWCDECDRTSV